jgi:hypothetical protein
MDTTEHLLSACDAILTAPEAPLRIIVWPDASSEWVGTIV